MSRVSEEPDHDDYWQVDVRLTDVAEFGWYTGLLHGCDHGPGDGFSRRMHVASRRWFQSWEASPCLHGDNEGYGGPTLNGNGIIRTRLAQVALRRHRTWRPDDSALLLQRSLTSDAVPPVPGAPVASRPFEAPYLTASGHSGLSVTGLYEAVPWAHGQPVGLLPQSTAGWAVDDPIDVDSVSPGPKTLLELSLEALHAHCEILNSEEL